MSSEVGQWDQGPEEAALMRLAYSVDRPVFWQPIPPGLEIDGHPVTGPWQFGPPPWVVRERWERAWAEGRRLPPARAEFRPEATPATRW